MAKEELNKYLNIVEIAQNEISSRVCANMLIRDK